MDWAGFIIQLLEHDLRLSSLEVENRTGIRLQIIDRWKKGLVGKPHRNTLRRLEDGLKINIDDRDPNNITYKKIESNVEFEKEVGLYKYPLVSEISAGLGTMIKESSDSVYLPYKKQENCFALKVVGNSMNGIIDEGDTVLIDMDAEVVNGNVVAVLLKDGRAFIKRYRQLEHELVQLYSNNTEYEPVIVKRQDIELIYRAVQIVKNI